MIGERTTGVASYGEHPLKRLSDDPKGVRHTIVSNEGYLGTYLIAAPRWVVTVGSECSRQHIGLTSIFYQSVDDRLRSV